MCLEPVLGRRPDPEPHRAPEAAAPPPQAAPPPRTKSLKDRIQLRVERSRPKWVEQFRAELGREPTGPEAGLVTLDDVARHLWDYVVELRWHTPTEQGQPVVASMRWTLNGLADEHEEALLGEANRFLKAVAAQLIQEAKEQV